MRRIFTPENLKEIIYQLTTKRKIFVAYSGGVDSHVLLHSLVKLRQDGSVFEIIAIHIHHGIYDIADFWQEHCQKICAALQVPCMVKKVAVKEKIARKQSLEAVARALRYQAFDEIVTNDGVLVTAHHADDQAETLLLQLLRGAGPKGLASIPSKSKLNGKELIRPLLSFTRDDIMQYARANNLQWIEDESNLDISIDRNYMRKQIIPLLKNKWPGMVQTLNRAAVNCYELSYLAEIVAVQDYALTKSRGVNKENTLKISKLLMLDVQRQRNVLRYFVQLMHLLLPSRIKIEEIQRTILGCAEDANPVVRWEGAEVRRYQDELYMMTPLSKHDASMILSWDLLDPLILPNNLGILQADLISAQAVNFAHADFTVRFRQGGEHCKPRGKQHNCELKKLLQEWNVPSWLRDRIPLVYRGNEIIAVVGYCECVGWPEGVAVELGSLTN